MVAWDINIDLRNIPIFSTNIHNNDNILKTHKKLNSHHNNVILFIKWDNKQTNRQTKITKLSKCLV